MPTKRMFDAIVIVSLGVHVVMNTLVKPWGAYRAKHAATRAGQLVGEVAVRAS